MSLNGQRTSTVGRLRQALQRMIFGRGRALRGWWGIDTNIDYEHEVGDAGRSDIVSSLVGWKQNVFPEAPLRLQEMDDAGKLQPVVKHPLLSLLRAPNPLYHGLALWKATIWDYAIDGNAFWMLVPTRSGGLAELQYLPRYMIEPGASTEQNIDDRYWDYTPASTPEKLPANRVLHFRDGIDPEDVRMGCSPLKNLFRELYTDAAAANVVAALLRNRAMPSAIISPAEGGEYDQGNIDETRQYVQEMFTGDNRGQPLVLGGATSIQTFGYSPADLEVSDVRYMVEERLCAALNVPGIVVNLGSGMRRSTYSNIASAREMAWENGMLPMLRDLAETLNTRLLPMVDPDGRLQFDFNISEVRVLQEDKTKLSQRNRIGVSGGWVTVAEARESEGRPWDPADNVYLRAPASTAVPVGAPAPPAPAPERRRQEQGQAGQAGHRARPAYGSTTTRRRHPPRSRGHSPARRLPAVAAANARGLRRTRRRLHRRPPVHDVAAPGQRRGGRHRRRQTVGHGSHPQPA